MSKVECENLCYHNDLTCEYCKKHRVVSKEFWKAKRVCNNEIVTGYLVKDKEGNIDGILNKATSFCELAWIDESTLVKE